MARKRPEYIRNILYYIVRKIPSLTGKRKRVIHFECGGYFTVSGIKELKYFFTVAFAKILEEFIELLKVEKKDINLAAEVNGEIDAAVGKIQLVRRPIEGDMRELVQHIIELLTIFANREKMPSETPTELRDIILGSGLLRAQPPREIKIGRDNLDFYNLKIFVRPAVDSVWFNIIFEPGAYANKNISDLVEKTAKEIIKIARELGLNPTQRIGEDVIYYLTPQIDTRFLRR